ncbi:hypothetical protein OW684_01625 [Acinetobacter baumannii]|nr:hypothetical protein [Acinetobacter baumannii]MDK2105112.1 hypothetical protein [Acinetobacter baumannii]MDK2110448.1 hypothetical protein [Acinetobacter baumannii]MDK2139958.1 hypothetical protein [Acinetobacter baumannii]MDK2150828.1 hypothetical protein [Acinetobacter baumannii]MDK2154566.1 hypothetical protein [Acinetobacter baumannii]
MTRSNNPSEIAQKEISNMNSRWDAWLRCAKHRDAELEKAKAQAVQQSFEIGRLQDRITELLDERQDLYAQINNDQAVPENTEDWYLDEDEGLWLDHDGIDGTLCELGIGEVKPVKHKEYLITQSNTLYAARVWDSDDDHIAWKLFESEESALEAATYCKQMYEASESGAEG